MNLFIRLRICLTKIASCQHFHYWVDLYKSTGQSLSWNPASDNYFVCVFRGICAIGSRTQIAVTSTVWSMKLERGLPFSPTTLKSQSQLKREQWVFNYSHRVGGKCRACIKHDWSVVTGLESSDVFPALMQRWTETYVRWSPKGTYLATFHQRGIALWGGEKFKQIQRFSHQGVSLIDFSPCER